MAIQEKGIVTVAGFQAQVVPPSQRAFTLTGPLAGAAGNAGDRLQRLILNIGVPSAANVSILDGWKEYQLVFPGPNVQVGPLVVELGMYSSLGPWSVRTGGGVQGVAVGVFS